MPGRIGLEVEYTAPELQPVERGDSGGPARILVLADFSARACRGVVEPGDRLADRPTPTVDVDNLNDLLFGYAPRLHLPLVDPAGPSELFAPREMDDFHPDGLYRSLDSFRALREMRARMLDPRTAAAEADALRTVEAPQDEPGEDDPELLERLLGRKPADRPVPRPRPPDSGIDITPFIRDLVRPWVVAAPTADQGHLVAALDQALGMQMRSVLSQPWFQSLEAAWRGVEWLTQRIELGEEIDLCLLDVSRQELVADLVVPGQDPRDSGLYRLLVEREARTPGARGWSALAGDFTFGPDEEDVALLQALGAVAAEAGGPFLAAAAPSLLGCTSLADSPDPRKWAALDPESERRWATLRRSAVARWLGLVLPRFLLRLPYGARTEPIDAFEFEEQSAPPEHDAYLWGNPSLACAMLLATRPGSHLQIDDLPAHAFERDGQTELTACSECYLTETAAVAMLRRGVMPLLSIRGRNAVRLAQFRSLAEQDGALAGPWG